MLQYLNNIDNTRFGGLEVCAVGK